jgi:hypothetical protein
MAESPVVLVGLPGLALVLTVLLTRPAPRRLAGALAAGVVVAVAVLNLLQVFARRGGIRL